MLEAGGPDKRMLARFVRGGGGGGATLLLHNHKEVKPKKPYTC